MIITFVYGLANSEERVFNRNMSDIFVGVEHSYEQLKQYLICQDFSSDLKV